MALATGISTWFELVGPEAGPRVLFIGGSQTTLTLPTTNGGPVAAAGGVAAEHERVRPHQQLADDGGCRVLAYDLRGVAESDKPAGPYTMAEYADDAASLLRAVGWADQSRPVAMVGVSFGGMIGWHLALRHPKLLARAVLCCGPPGGAAGDGWRHGDGAPYPYHELPTRWFTTPREHTLAVMHLVDSRHDDVWQAANPVEVEAAVAAAEGQTRSCATSPGGLAGAEALMQCRGHHDSSTSGDIATLSLPLLLAGGKFDAMVPQATIERARERVNTGKLRCNAEVAMFEGGHGFLGQDPTAWPAVISFVTADSDSSDGGSSKI